MLTQTVRFPFDRRYRVMMIQRTCNSTWTMLIKQFDRTTLSLQYYIRHTEAEGAEIKVYKVNSFCVGFTLVSESKILVLHQDKSRNMVIDLLKGTSDSFPFPTLNHDNKQFKIFRFYQSGLLCLHSSYLSSPLIFQNQQCITNSQTLSYFSQSSLEEGKPLLEYKNTYKHSYFNSSMTFSMERKANEHSLIISYSTRPGNNLALLLHDVVLSHGKAESRVRYLEQTGLWGYLLWQISQNSFLKYYFQRPLEDSFQIENKVLKSEDESFEQQIVVKNLPFSSESLNKASQTHRYYPIVFNIDGRICWQSKEHQSLKIFDPQYSSWDSIRYQPIQQPFYKKCRISRSFSKWQWHDGRSFEKSSWNPSVLFYHYLNEENSTITIITLEFFSMKDKLMHLLLSLNEDFDDDLLLDALDLIDCI